MTENDKKEFVAIIHQVATVLPKDITESLLEMYWQALSDMTIEDAKQGFARAVRESSFFPTPATVRELSGFSYRKAYQAEQAWITLTGADIWRDGYLTFDDKTIHATIRVLGGLDRFRSATEQEWSTWIRPKFIERYLEFLDHPPEDHLTKRLGYLNSENERLRLDRGLSATKTKRIQCQYLAESAAIEDQSGPTAETLAVMTDLTAKKSL